MKICYTGKESSGKSLKLASVAVKLVKRNYAWYKKSGIQRSIASNLKFSENFEKFAESNKIPIIYWSNLDDLVKLKDCDVIIDEIPNYFDARGWKELNLNVRRWMTQAAKAGVEMYCSAQDFAQVDIAFRRLINHLYLVKKVIGSRRPSATRPPVKYIWGITSIVEIDPKRYDDVSEKFNRISSFPEIFWITKEACEIFDTRQIIELSEPLKMDHTERYCKVCKYKRVEHK